LADKAYKKERYSEARNLYRCSLSIVGNWETYTPELSMTLQRLSKIYINVGNDARAEQLLQRLMVLDEKHMGPYYRDVGVDAYLLGFIYADQGKFDKAEPMFKRALNIFEKQVSPNDRDISLMLSSLADVYRKTDRSGEADEMESRAKKIEETKSI
jgi:tetratricopeptide (TPR) repeat protein